MAGIELMKAMVAVQADSSQARGDISSFKQFVEQEMDGVTTSIAGITGSITAFGVGAIGAGIQLAGSMEQSKIAFATMLGSAEAATKMLEELNQFAASTPFEIPGIVQATKTLLAFQIPQEDIMDTLKAIGDISAGTGKDFAELSVIYGQIAASGKLMGGDLNQLINAGFNPLNEIAKKTGKSVAELKEEMSKGKISFDMVKQAFIDATSEGGQFFNMMEAQSKSLFGLFSTLQDGIGAILRSVGQALMEPAKALIKFGITAAEVFGGVIKSTGTLIPNIFTATTAMTGLTTAVTGTAIAFRALGISMRAALIGTGVGIVVVALGAVVGILYEAISNLAEAGKFTEAWSQTLRNLQDAWTNISAVMSMVWNSISEAIGGILPQMEGGFVGFINGALIRFSAFVLEISEWIRAIAENWDSVWRAMPLAVDFVFSYLSDLLSNLQEFLPQAIGYALKMAQDAVFDWGVAVVSAIGAAFKEIPALMLTAVVRGMELMRTAIQSGGITAAIALGKAMAEMQNQVNKAVLKFAKGYGGVAPDVGKLFEMSGETQAKFDKLKGELSGVLDRKAELEASRTKPPTVVGVDDASIARMAKETGMEVARGIELENGRYGFRDLSNKFQDALLKSKDKSHEGKVERFLEAGLKKTDELIKATKESKEGGLILD